MTRDFRFNDNSIKIDHEIDVGKTAWAINELCHLCDLWPDMTQFYSLATMDKQQWMWSVLRLDSCDIVNKLECFTHCW